MTWWKNILGCKNASKASISNIGMEFPPCDPNPQCLQPFFFPYIRGPNFKGFIPSRRDSTLLIFSLHTCSEKEDSTQQKHSAHQGTAVISAHCECYNRENGIAVGSDLRDNV